MAVLASALLALVPGAAFAHGHPGGGRGRSGRCAVNIAVAPHQIVAGEAVEISGGLTCGGVGVSGQTVELFQYTQGTAGFVGVQNTSTEASGGYKFSVTSLTANSTFYVRALGARSATQRVQVAAQVTLSGPAEGSQLLTGVANQVTFTGTVNPADAGARAILQRQDAVGGQEWHRIGAGQVEAGGSFSIVHAFRVPGDASIRVIVRSHRLNLPSVSNVLEYEISQQQNPNLTINASTDPIVYGQSVTISGTLAGGVNTPVVLLARTVHQRGFAPVAQVNTNASGAYSFPAQSPVNSTLYEVKTGRRHQKSAVLWEGVKDVLSASVSATTVQSGQPVTFSGTLAPEQAGHVVYLEREDASGAGYHVIQVGHVLAGGTYSIVHQFYVPGAKVVRVSVPGGPSNSGTASGPFTITVTPVPGVALMPEAPGNSSLPAEGQVQGGGGEGQPAE